MKTRTFFIGLFTLLAVACQQDGSKEPVMEPMYFELNNAELENAIKDYQEMIFADNAKYMEMGDSVYIGIHSQVVNDTTTKMVLRPIISASWFTESAEPFLITKVNGHDVFLIATSYFSSYPYNNEDGFFSMTEVTKNYLFKRFFPKEWKEEQLKERLTKAGEEIPMKIGAYDPKICVLTFVKDSLVEKTIEYGMSICIFRVNMGD